MDNIAKIASLSIALSMLIGGMGILFTSVSERWNKTILGLGAGMLLGEAIFALILPSLNGGIKRVALVILGIAIGVILLSIVNNYLSQEHFYPWLKRVNDRPSWLFIIAIFVQNFPEGLAVGIGYDPKVVMDVVTGISLENIREGLLIAKALVELGYFKGAAIGISFLSGLLEPIMGVIGSSIVNCVDFLLT